MLLPALAILVILLLVYLLFRERMRRRHLIHQARLEHMAALDFIAQEQAELPHEFAAIFLAGNRPAMDAKFPEYEAFRSFYMAMESD